MDEADWWTGGRCGVRKPGRGGLGRTGGLTDAVDYGILDGANGAGWGGRGGLEDWRTQQTQRTMESWTGRTTADGADWGGQDGLGRTGRTRAYWVELGGADWEAWGGRDSGLGGQIGMRTSSSTGLFAS